MGGVTMSKWAHLLVLASSSPFPATMRKWAHLLVCRGRCGIMDPAGVGCDHAAGVAVAGSSIACSSVRAPKAFHRRSREEECRIAGGACVDPPQHLPTPTPTYHHTSGACDLWPGRMAYTIPHEDSQGWRVASMVDQAYQGCCGGITLLIRVLFYSSSAHSPSAPPILRHLFLLYRAPMLGRQGGLLHQPRSSSLQASS